MRVSSGMYYDNLYSSQNSHLTNKLFDVNKQISSGLKIQYASDDVSAFAETMRLDNEVSALEEVSRSAQSAYKVSNQTDQILNDFNDSMDRMRTLMIQGANDTNDETSMDAISAELRGLEKHLKNLSNTSINGQFLFSGSLVDVKPISDDGTYNGNDVARNAFLGSNVKQQFNISGAELFLGEEVSIKREVVSNVPNMDLVEKYERLGGSGEDRYLDTDNTIRDLMGDTDNEVDTNNNKHFFYIRGADTNGTAIKEKFSMSDEDSVDSLLEKIGTIYGNTADLSMVNVSMNNHGQIEIEDKLRGSSKIEFHMVGALDLDGGGDADVTDIDDLDDGEQTFSKIMNGTSTANNPNLHVKEFMFSGLDSTDSSTKIDGLMYDRTQFTKNGSKVTSSVPQVLKDTNAFASNSTKLSEVADITQGTIDPSDDTLSGTTFKLEGIDTSGNSYDVTIDLDKSAVNGGNGSSFTIGGDTYDIFTASSPRTAVDADDMTYRQLMDVVNMVVTGNLPAGNTTSDYDKAIETSNYAGGTNFTYDGKIEFGDMLNSNSKATISLYDSTTDDFSAGTRGSTMTFNTNNALIISDAKTDFFKTVDKMIEAMESYEHFPDAKSGDAGGIGIEYGIAMMDDLQTHIFRSHSMVGAQSNVLDKALERTAMLEITTKTLRSSVIDTDLAEASLELTKLSLNYEAMLSTVGKVSKLSLVNYL